MQGTPVDPEDVPEIELIDYENQFIPLVFASTQYDTYTTTLQVTQSCSQTVTGQTDGYVNQYSQHSYILMNSDYPSSLHCNYNYKDTAVQYTKICVGGSCSVTLADNDGGIVFYCPNIGTNNDPLTVTTIFITANAYYDWGWLPFTATNGWASIVYQ